MKYFLTLFIFFSVAVDAQKNNVFRLSTNTAWNTAFAKGWIGIDSGWKLKAGDNPGWAKPGFDDSGWQAINVFKDLNNTPAVFSVPGIVWFRIRVKTDSTLLYTPLVMRMYQTGASEVYLDGKLIHQLGVVNANPPTVVVSTMKERDKVLLSVRDNDNGIPQNTVDKIFQPFFTTKPTGQGTGLGLSLAYDSVKAHGGEIKVESKENEGSAFLIQLPS